MKKKVGVLDCTPKISLKVPRVPNFFLAANGPSDEKYSIADFPDAELQRIGEIWITHLIQRAHQIRKDRSEKTDRFFNKGKLCQ